MADDTDNSIAQSAPTPPTVDPRLMQASAAPPPAMGPSQPQIPILQHANPPAPHDILGGIMLHTAGIHNPFLRTLARAGAIMGTSAAGPQAITALQNQQQEAENKLMQAQHQNEIVDLKAQHAAELKEQEEQSQADLAAANRAEKEKETVTKAGEKTIQMGDKTYQYDPNSDSFHPIGAGKTPVPAHLQGVAGTVNGKPTFANHNPDTGKYYDPQTGAEIPDFKPPLTYAQSRPFTQQVMDTEGRPVDVQYDPTSNSWKPINTTAATSTPASGAAGHQMFQAGNIVRVGDDVIADVQKYRDQLGAVGTWIEKYGINTPIGDPVLAGVQTHLRSFAALNPGLHGFRGANAAERFENLIGDLQKNPDAIVASIKSIQATAGEMLPPKPAAAGSPAVGTIRKYQGASYRFKGGDWHDKNNWEKQ